MGAGTPAHRRGGCVRGLLRRHMLLHAPTHYCIDAASKTIITPPSGVCRLRARRGTIKAEPCDVLAIRDTALRAPAAATRAAVRYRFVPLRRARAPSPSSFAAAPAAPLDAPHFRWPSRQTR